MKRTWFKNGLPWVTLSQLSQHDLIREHKYPAFGSEAQARRVIDSLLCQPVPTRASPCRLVPARAETEPLGTVGNSWGRLGTKVKHVTL